MDGALQTNLDAATGWRRPAVLSAARLQSVALSTIAPLAVLALWWWATAHELAPAEILVSPALVAQTFVEMLGSGELLEAALVSGRRVALGFIVGSAIGLLLGGALARLRWLDRTLGIGVTLLAQVPGIAWTPLIIALFGIGETYKIFLIAFACFFPVVVKTREGMLSIQRSLLEVAEVLALPTFARYRRVIVPAALPQIMAGVRIALSKAWLSVVFAELFAASAGLGYLMNAGRMYFQMEVVMCAAIVAGLLGYGTDLVFARLERRLIKAG